MKKILFALTLFALLLPTIPRANGAEISVDFFYNNISGGSWIEAEDYGYGWQPDAAVSDPDWRPYADGYWAYTDYGWTWVSYEDYGWATYHYGRWAKLEDTGWVWFPGSDLEWGPAWVSWRTGGDQIGWAPLPPRGVGVVYDGRPIGGRVDVEFDIGPAYYNFVDVRFIGEPVLRSHIYAPSYNVTYINQTVNVTNISVKNKVVYNYGPDINVLSQHSARPIQRLKIERQTNVDVGAVARSGGLTKVQGDRLVVAAPQTVQRSARPIAPPTVKTKVARNKIERGWKGMGDAKAESDLKQKMKTEDLKKIPPPTAGAAAQPAGGAPPATLATAAPPMEKGKHRRPGERGEPVTQGAPGIAPGGSSMEEPMVPERGKGKGKLGKAGKPDGPDMTPAPPTGTTIEGAEATSSEGKFKGKRGRPMPSELAPSTGAQTDAPENAPPAGKQRARRLEPGQAPSGAAGPVEGGQPPEGKMGKQQGRRLDPGQAPSGAAGPVEGGQPPEGKMGKRQGQPAIAPAGGAPAGQPGAGQPERGKKKKGEREEPAPAPTP